MLVTCLDREQYEDGVGLSIVLASEKPVHRASNDEGGEQRTAAEKRKYAQGVHAARVEHLGALLKKDAICRGLDPRGVNLYTTAQSRVMVGTRSMRDNSTRTKDAYRRVVKIA
jgi:hypothetical protein